jgi:gamma-glutamylcyclotransferase (GGCT)/AIG2-like uncharacterized protein YtfP
MKLFVYGTLKYPEIVTALTGKVFKHIDANLAGYRIVALQNKPYPGLVISDRYSAIGKIIDVDEKSYKVISNWEDTEYSPIEVTVKVGKDQIKAVTFLHNAKAEQLTTDWDEENFIDNHLIDYVQNRIPKFLSH